MPIDKEFLTAQLQGVEKSDEKITAILSEYDKEKLSILKNKDDILAEKNALELKLKDNTAKITELEEAKKALDESIKSGLPDKEKKIFEADIKTLKDQIEMLTGESTKMKTEYDSKIKTLSDEKTHYIIGEEFTKLINGNTAIFPALKNGLVKRFFADYPKQLFGPYEYNGKTEYVINDGPNKGKKMGDLLTEFLNSDEGKYYVENKNTGGGARGQPNAAGGTENSIARSQFDQMSYAERKDYLSKGGKIHN